MRKTLGVAMLTGIVVAAAATGATAALRRG